MTKKFLMPSKYEQDVIVAKMALEYHLRQKNKSRLALASMIAGLMHGARTEGRFGENYMDYLIYKQKKLDGYDMLDVAEEMNLSSELRAAFEDQIRLDKF